MPSLFGESGRSGFQPPPTLTFGVWGDSKDGVGVLGTTNNFNNAGVWGDNPGGPNEDNTATGVGVRSTSTDGYGMFGSSINNVGVLGTSETAIGVQGSSTSNSGVRAFSETGWGLITETFTGVALLVL